MSDTRKATPAETLERHITDPRIPKSESEWWAHREIEKQSEENERLREALRRIGMPDQNISYCWDGHEIAVLIAREALEGKP